MRSSIAPGLRGPGWRQPWQLVGAALLAACAHALPGAALAQGAGLREPPADVPAFSDPRTATTAYQQVTRLVTEGRRDAAMVALEEALRAHPRNPQLRFLYGVLLAEARRPDDAIAVFEQITQDYPELPEPYNNLAVMHAARGELDRARGALEAAVRALPGYALAHENLGDVHLRLAVRAWERAASLDPTSATSRVRLALAREMIARITPTAAAPAGTEAAGAAPAVPATGATPASAPAPTPAAPAPPAR